MIKSLTVVNPRKEELVLELGRPELTGVNVKSIDGVSLAKANLVTQDIGVSDGSRFLSGRVPTRNITLELGVGYDSDAEDIRHLTYKFFPLKKNITLKFETGSRYLEIEGYVESNEVDIFSSDETANISILCPDPYFYKSGFGELMVTTFDNVTPLFEFPFSNESLTDNLIELGRYSINEITTVDYPGDADVGIDLFIDAYGPVGDITVYKNDTGESIKIITSYIQGGFKKGDTLLVRSKIGSKNVYLIRNGEYIPMLKCLDRLSSWFQLSSGKNGFSYTATSGKENLHFRIENYIAYGGI